MATKKASFQVRVWLPDATEHVQALDPLPFSIGRRAGNALELPHETVSGTHAEILREGGRLVLVDRGSTNGTWVREARLPADAPYPVEGAEFQIGPYRLRVEPVGAAAAPGGDAPGGAWARLFTDAVDDVVDAGKSTYVRWQVGGVRSYSVAGEQQSAASGSMEVWPVQRTTYRLEGIALDGSPVTRERVITVRGRAAGPVAEPGDAQGLEEKDELLGLERLRPKKVDPKQADEKKKVDPKQADEKKKAPDNRLASFLPAIYHQSALSGMGQGGDLIAALLRMADGIWRPLEQTIDHFALYLDPYTAPDTFVPVLAAWLGLDTMGWPEDRLRDLIHAAPDLYAMRGTPWGLERHLEVLTGMKPHIDDRVIDQPGLVYVEVWGPAAWLDRGETQEEIKLAIRDIVAFHLPVHARCEWRLTAAPST